MKRKWLLEPCTGKLVRTVLRGAGRSNEARLPDPQYGNGAALTYTGGRWGQLTLAKLGTLKVRMHRAIAGTIKTVTIQRDGDQWYVCFSCVVDITPLPAAEAATGVDLGLLHFATLADGSTINNPRPLRRARGRLAAAQQRLSRCQRGSHRRDRARRALSRLHRKVRNRRADFLHKVARRLVNAYGLIALEELRPGNLSRRPAPRPNADGTAGYEHNGAAAKAGLNRSIFDAGWGIFAKLLAAKAAWAGRRVVFVNPAYTSQMCSGCGAIRRKELSERWHSCTCGTELDRDHNAALNILRLGWSQRTHECVEAAPL